MKHLLFALFFTTFLVGCGSSSDDALPPAITDNQEVREDQVQQVVEVACDIFSSEHNNDADSFIDAFPKLNQDCENQEELSDEEKEAAMESYQMAYELFASFDKDAHKSCLPLMKRVIKTSFHMVKRSLKEQTDRRTKQQILAKGALENHLRGLVGRGCLVDFDQFNYMTGEEERSFEFSANHLRNGSFEIIKDVNSNQFVELARQWDLFSNKKVPAWKIKVVDGEEGKDCSFLEVQGDGVVTNVPDGFHLVELDGHCKNENGNRVSGDARVQISQSFFVKRPGSYRLTMKAQRRGGNQGELHTAIFQRGRNKEFIITELPNSSVWTDVCIDHEVLETEKTIKVFIKDGDETGRSTYGLLLDDVAFEEGSCL